MTPEQHIQTLLDTFGAAARKKYDTGQEEHGGKLWRKPIMNYVMDEIIDMVIYWFTFRFQWQELRALLVSLELRVVDDPDVPEDVTETIGRIINLMDIGNPDGEWEEELDASHSAEGG